MAQPQEPMALACYRHPDRGTFIRCQRCERPICGDCMISAAVGFQCPECVATAAKQSRQNVGPYGGKRSADPRLTTFALIGVNLVVWVLTFLLGDQFTDLVALRARGICLSSTDPGMWYPDAVGQAACSYLGGTFAPGVADGAWWQIITSAFTHTEIWHIGMNMLSLWFLGPPIEAALGRVRFLAVYLFSGIFGSLAVLWISSPTTQVLGASGAIFGLIGALLAIQHKIHADLRFVLSWLALNVVYSFAVPGISWEGHLGGLIGGLAATEVIIRAPRERRSQVQLLGLGALTILTLALIGLRVFQIA